MNLMPFFKSILNEDKAPIVVCDLGHRIIFMNPSAIDRYSGYGGASLLGKSLLGCHNEKSVEIINRVLGWFKESTDNNRVYTYFNEKENKDVYMVALRDESGELIGYYEKHEYRTREGGPPLAIPALNLQS